MIVRDRKSFGALATPDDDDPTVGVTISPWVIALVAAVYVVPKLFHTYRTTRREEKKR